MPIVGVVGHPISHSLSPKIHNAALAHDGSRAVYEAFDVLPEGFSGFIDDLRRTGARGLNVTVPHKTAAYELASRRSDDAERTGAANTLLFEDDDIVAHNTDVTGIRRALEELGVPPGSSALVVGAGGAGRAAVWALRGSGAEAQISVTNRTPDRARAAAALGQATVVAWDDRAAAAGQAELVIQATSLGLGPTEPPLDGSRLGRTRFVLDLVYGPGETALVRAARAAGIRAADGLAMLVYQAAAAYGLFWEREAPIHVMRHAAEEATGRLHPAD